MTAKSTNRSDAAEPEVEETSEDYLDEQYEEEIKELVERLVRRGRPRPSRPKASRPKPEAKPQATPESDPEPEAGAVREPEADSEAKPEAAEGSWDKPEPKAGNEAKPGAKAKAEAKPEPKAETEAGPEAATEAETASAAETEEPRADEAELQRRVRLLSRVTIVLAAAFALALAAAATFGFYLLRNADDQNPRQQVAERAGLIATTLFNYDYRNLGGYPARQTSVMSSALAANAKKGRAAMLDMITKGQLVWNAKVNQVYVADVHGSTAWAIIDSDAKVTSSKLIATLTGTVTRFKLVKEHGVWLLAQPPETLSQGTETDTDLQGNPLSPSASPTPSK